MEKVHVVRHPLVEHHLTRLRDVETEPAEFRRLIRRLAVLLAYEATQDLRLTEQLVRTPLTEMVGARLDQRIGLIPILRAGLGMVEPVLDLIPSAEVWHLGVYRDERTLQPIEYYRKIPDTRPVDVGLVLDPMLATGGSAIAALTTLARWGVPARKLLSVIAAPEGIRTVAAEHPGTPIHVCVIDERLNERGYIVPGLGDAGDRTFNTTA